METKLSPAAFVFAAISFTLTLLSASIVAPQNVYFRWQELDSGTTRKADWIYERLHFDPTPIDVALIGTSRTGGGLSGPDIEAAYCRATGRRIQVANLSLPETGRNLNFVVAKEVMRTKSPALTVVELNATEARRQHRGFVILADAADILTAPLIGNLSFFPDLVRLPGRQAILMFRTLAGDGAVRDGFDPAKYEGRDLDRTRELRLLDGSIISRYSAMAAADLDAAHEARLRKMTRMLHLPEDFRDVEYRVPRVYLDKIESLAAHNNRSLSYVFMPAWREPAFPNDLASILDIDGPVIDLGGPIATDPGKWLDATHVNAWGAEELSARFADRLSADYPDLGEKGC